MKLKSKVILISGASRSGKSTLANLIKENYENKNIRVCELQISYYLKDYVHRIFGWDLQEETKPRELLQSFGTEYIREELNMSSLFIDRTLEDINVFKKYYDVFIISDIRLPYEIDRIKNEVSDVTVIKIIRDSDELSLKQKSHNTEIALNNFNEYDIIIDNNGNFEELSLEVNKLFYKGDI